MGRFFGRRPDPTRAIARGVRGVLEPGERVLAGIHVQRPGTTAAALRGGTSGAVGAAVGNLPPSFDDVETADWNAWHVAAAQLGLEPRLLTRTTLLALALTTRRLLVVRRSQLTRRHRELLGAWPLDHVDVRVPRNGSSVHLRRGEHEFELELPLAHRFLPDVYREFPDLLAGARR